ncbi:MAG: threonylcarbamoyl-AMP synthase [Deltaproteobacteria bacterium]|nr:threonylcarbamoyl-AMP synthase [Deltaproteobacteria bacterium]
MLRLQFDDWGEPPARKIAAAVEVIHRGGVAAYPTDSVFALGCAIEARDAIERIHRIKGMKKSQRLALICPDLSSASRYGQFSQTAFRLAQRVFPGPYTLVVPATREVPRTLTDNKRRTVGIRVTSNAIAQALVVALGRPLLTTSAARDGGEPCRDADEIIETFGDAVDVVIDSSATNELPSTIIEIDGDDITVIREGQGPIDGLF